MKKTFNYAIVSTFATDIIYFLDKRIVEKHPGGSGYWIRRVFDKNNINYTIFSGEYEASIEAKITEGQPLPGKIKNLSPIIIREKASFDGTVICTMKDEFNILDVGKISGVIALDVAGFTRKGKWGEKKGKVELPPSRIRKKITILKANHEELPFIPKEWIDEQKQKRILLHTLGGNGVDMWTRGKQYHFKAPDLQPKNVLGAGDTFIASFLVAYLENKNDSIKACNLATEEVNNLFLEKIRSEQL